MTGPSDVAMPPDLPPGPGLPRSRQTARWLAGPVRFLQSLQRSFGDVFTIHLLRESPWVMVSDPDLVRQIFTAPSDVLHAGRGKRILEPVLGPGSVLLSDGERHMRQRRLLLPAFDPQRVSFFEQEMRAVAEAEMSRWPLGVEGPAAPRMNAIALEVIMRLAFGPPAAEHLAPLREAIDQLMDYLGDARRALVALGKRVRLGEDRFSELGELLARVDELVFAEIGRRRSSHGERYPDVLSVLLDARHEDGSMLSDRELRDELMTVIIAGHETTAGSLAWALERLVRNPGALAKTVAEAPTGGGRYTDALVWETLRLRSPFLVVPRLAVKPFRLGEFAIPPGVAVTPAIPLVHRRPDVYPDPEEFRPERFLAERPGTYSWIPFGGGVRRCIGAGFSMLEMRVVLSTLLRCATVRAADAEPELPRRRLLVVSPSRGARVILEPR